MIVPAAPDVVDEPPAPPAAPVPLLPALATPPFPPAPAPGSPGGICASDVHATAQRHAATCPARMQAGARPSIARIDPTHLARGIAILPSLSGGRPLEL